MAIDQITTGVIKDDAVTNTKVADNLTLPGSYVKIPAITTVTRDALSASVGMLIYNTTLGITQQYNAQGWVSVDLPPTVSSLNYPGDDTALDTVGEFNLTCTTQSSTTVLAASTTGIAVGQIVTGTGISTVNNLTCGLTNADATVTVAGSTTGLVVGMSVAEFTGVPTGATILSIIADTSFELSANATATNASAVLSFNTTVSSIITNTSFVISPTATAGASVSLTFNTQTLVITGTNFQTGVTVLIDGTAPSTITRNSSTQITVTGTPAKTAGTKSNGLLITNPTGLTGSIDIDYNALPDWTTASGNVLTAQEGATISTVDLAATSATSYAITSGALPASLAMSTSTGDITGTLSASAATFNFTVTATDAEAQSAPRLFNIIVVAPPTGGTITTYSGFRVHTFTNTAASEDFVVGATKVCDILIIAGGGGGNTTYHGAGGGAGGFVYYSQKSLSAATYAIAVGAKGSGGTATTNDHNATNGTQTTFATLTTAVGGGRGGYGADTDAAKGQIGGSGGGAGTFHTTSSRNIGGAGTQYQGFKGGDVPASPTAWQGTGGGGGAGAVGAGGTSTFPSNSGVGGAGGAGKTTGDTVYNFTAGGGATVTFPANFTNGSSATSYCGGGGGSGNTSGGAATHGGGAGSTGGGANATLYGAGGGGSARQGGSFKGGDGSQGIVIIRYAV